MQIIIKNARVLMPDSTWVHGWLACNNEQIQHIGQGEPPDLVADEVIDARGLMLLPGFIDLHAHGALGCEAMDATPESLGVMAKFYAQHGVTAFLATTWTASHEALEKALVAVCKHVGRQVEGATLLGTHLEGPYLNADKCGAQDVRHIRRAERNEANALLDLCGIRLLALAPEFAANHWLIAECVRRGITVSAAHTDATYEQMQDAVARGLSQATHTFNAMRGLHHRQPGCVGAALTISEIRCELIADGIHVHPAVIKILYAAKGAHGIILITDAVRGAGLPVGSQYEQDGRQVTVQDGAAYLSDGTLAGSTLTMDRALFNLMRATGAALEDVWPASSLNAARALNIAEKKGSLEVGKHADLILVDDAINVHLTVAEGQIVYRKVG